MPSVQRITPCLWFDDQAEEAAKFYASIFPNSSIGHISRFTDAGKELHGKEPGSVMTVSFVLDGQEFTGLNGGPMFQFSEAVSFQVICESAAEADFYWARLGEGGDPAAQQCGWLKDKFGLSWQVFPRELLDLMNDPDKERVKRVSLAMFQMKKIDIEALRKA